MPIRLAGPPAEFRAQAIGVVSLETVTKPGSQSSASDAGRPATAQGEDAPVDSVSNFSRRARILIVDDHDINRRLARDMLHAMGHLADAASDGASAIDAVARNTYDAVLMDLQMPGMDGLAAIRLIRALPEPKRHVAIVVVTASLAPEEIARCKSHGANGCLSKPYSMSELAEAIDPWLPAPAEPGAADTGVTRSESGQTGLPRNFQPRSDPQSPALPHTLRRLREAFLEHAQGFRALLAAYRDGRVIDETEGPEAGAIRDAAHKLRGSAAAFGFPNIGEAAGRLEDAFDDAHESGRLSSPPDIAIELAISDLIEALDAVLGKAAPSG